ncbi:unnamed protein product [Macrosiphum euphorbiae]|uniref:Uncharacterized protein n=1 Tax=Macrosiphum euphorbiae TaxID=13131 RepID=A0AAV0XRG2_9HEMI|nr:unnamed protein product [Macrosiphum euphorbiae]
MKHTSEYLCFNCNEPANFLESFSFVSGTDILVKLSQPFLSRYFTGKIPIGRPRIKRKYVLKNNVEELGGGTDLMTRTDQEGWIECCMLGWSEMMFFLGTCIELFYLS